MKTFCLWGRDFLICGREGPCDLAKAAPVAYATAVLESRSRQQIRGFVHSVFLSAPRPGQTHLEEPEGEHLPEGEQESPGSRGPADLRARPARAWTRSRRWAQAASGEFGC